MQPSSLYICTHVYMHRICAHMARGCADVLYMHVLWLGEPMMTNGIINKEYREKYQKDQDQKKK